MLRRYRLLFPIRRSAREGSVRPTVSVSGAHGSGKSPWFALPTESKSTDLFRSVVCIHCTPCWTNVIWSLRWLIITLSTHQTLFRGHSPRGKPSMRTRNNSKDGQKQAGFGNHAQYTHPTEGLDNEKVSQAEANLHFSNIPNTGKRWTRQPHTGPNSRPGLRIP